MTTDERAAHTAAEELMANLLATVPADGWERPTTCVGWTVRDLAGHVTWGRDLLRHRARGEEIADRAGAPGAERPGDYLDGDPVAAYRAAWQACDAALTDEALAGPAPDFVRRVAPEATLGSFLDNMTSDLLAHAWDISDALGRPLEVPAELLEVADAATAGGVPRRPGFFAPEESPRPDAGPIDRYAAYLGRTPLAAR